MLPDATGVSPPGSEAAQDALIRLAAWDHVMAAERAEPLIYMAWLRELMRVLFADELGATFRDYFTIRENAIFDALEPGATWCDNTNTVAEEDCAAAAGTALDHALNYLAERYGQNMDSWAWGEAHYAHSKNKVLSRVPVIGKLFEVRLANGGARNTVNAAGFVVRDEEKPFGQNHGPAYRAIYDMDPLGQSRFIQNTGQSGNPLSPHYDDQLRYWLRGESLKMPYSDEAVDSATLSTLRLSPEKDEA